MRAGRLLPVQGQPRDPGRFRQGSAPGSGLGSVLELRRRAVPRYQPREARTTIAVTRKRVHARGRLGETARWWDGVGCHRHYAASPPWMVVLRERRCPHLRGHFGLRATRGLEGGVLPAGPRRGPGLAPGPGGPYAIRPCCETCRAPGLERLRPPRQVGSPVAGLGGVGRKRERSHGSHESRQRLSLVPGGINPRYPAAGLVSSRGAWPEEPRMRPGGAPCSACFDGRPRLWRRGLLLDRDRTSRRRRGCGGSGPWLVPREAGPRSAPTRARGWLRGEKDCSGACRSPFPGPGGGGWVDKARLRRVELCVRSGRGGPVCGGWQEGWGFHALRDQGSGPTAWAWR